MYRSCWTYGSPTWGWIDRFAISKALSTVSVGQPKYTQPEAVPKYALCSFKILCIFCRNTMDFLHLSHCNLYTYDFFLLLSHIVFCCWISHQQSHWLFILPLFCPYSILNQTTWLSEQGNLNIELYLKQRLCGCLYLIIKTRDCQIPAACITCPQGKLKGGRRVVALVVFRRMRQHLSKFGSLGPGLLAWSCSGQQEIQSIYLFPFRFPCCSMHHPQCICVSVSMVTLSTVYFLMLTHNSVPSTWGKRNLWCLRHTGVALRNLTCTASMTMPMDGPTP